MEHINVKNLGNGMVRLTPDNGYTLYNVRTRQNYSEAVVKENQKSIFRAVKI